MPSNRKQLNIRLDSETEAEVQRLIAVLTAEREVPISQSDLFRIAVTLGRQYPPEPVAEKKPRK